ncbi:hypothetical protein DL96DRAFT_1610964 [Flagelloscypha sp. PMI_526]|nr:hypothetical protein DL96DRAFT_1610964 [Flagelloscypha sp. PMI_526]
MPNFLDLPRELQDVSLSYLYTPSLQALCLSSSALRQISFSHLFRTLFIRSSTWSLICSRIMEEGLNSSTLSSPLFSRIVLILDILPLRSHIHERSSDMCMVLVNAISKLACIQTLRIQKGDAFTNDLTVSLAHFLSWIGWQLPKLEGVAVTLPHLMPCLPTPDAYTESVGLQTCDIWNLPSLRTFKARCRGSLSDQISFIESLSRLGPSIEALTLTFYFTSREQSRPRIENLASLHFPRLRDFTIDNDDGNSYNRSELVHGFLPFLHRHKDTLQALYIPRFDFRTVADQKPHNIVDIFPSLLSLDAPVGWLRLLVGPGFTPNLANLRCRPNGIVQDSWNIVHNLHSLRHLQSLDIQWLALNVLQLQSLGEALLQLGVLTCRLDLHLNLVVEALNCFKALRKLRTSDLPELVFHPILGEARTNETTSEILALVQRSDTLYIVEWLTRPDKIPWGKFPVFVQARWFFGWQDGKRVLDGVHTISASE